MAEATEYTMILNLNGIKVELDRIDEPLSHLELGGKAQDTTEDEESSEPVMGFADIDPDQYWKQDDTEDNQPKELRKLMAKNLDKALGKG
jgi:hypothetical protein